jgi:hypothetical protein
MATNCAAMMIETESICPVCGSKIKIERVKNKPAWSAECSCSYLEHPHMTGITLRLKLKAKAKAEAMA